MNTNPQDDLYRYQNNIRFPPQLEYEFREDFSVRQIPVLRRFFSFGAVLYLSFMILDYWALPFFYRNAWALRIGFGAVMLASIYLTPTKFFKRNIFWMAAAWAFWAGLSVLVIIYFSAPQEAGFIFYAFGLLLIIAATYIPSSGDLFYPSLAGWVTVIAYILVGIFRQNLLLTQRGSTFFIVCFFLVSMNILGMIGGYMLVHSQRRDFLLRRVIEKQRATEENLRNQADRLLRNVLPGPVAERLKRGEFVADVYEAASILFADMVSFTPFSGSLELHTLVDMLNEVFSHFDNLAEQHGLEKIKTTGDGYMVAAGIPVPRPDHAEVLIRLGMEMCDYFSRETFLGRRVGLRVGVNSGPVVGAVIGLQKFSYDLWGDTVNIASRMESHGQSGVVQITDNTYQLVKDKFVCEPQGLIEVKGRGQMNVWHVIGEK